MEQIEIKQFFLDEIRSGRKQFEVRKDADLEGIVELVVKDNEKTIKDSLIVKLTKRDMNTYEIGEFIGKQKMFLSYNKSNENEFKLHNMYETTSNFLSYWTRKDDRQLYFYDLEIVKDKDYE